ncbi:MAG TPA: ATP-grasp domain-containing protein [Candidatus Binatia bacterium]|jgi:biotin carboxylase|nr:ATP-grasp domain-containing protein [Candidatus Binatia bacterium]
MSAPVQSGLVLFLGMVRRGEFESLHQHDLPLGILIDTNSKHRLGDVSRFKLVERFDFSRPLPELIEAVRAIQARSGIACLYNVIEFYVAQTAHVAAALGVPCLSPASARLCLDKSLMRQRFHERLGPGAAARFQVVTSESALMDFARQMGYPVFLQPANVSASMWATRNTGPEMLRTNYHAILNEVPRYYEKLGKKGTQLVVVVAEYLEGSNISIDCLADRAGKVYSTPVVDVLTGRDIGIDDYHHFARLVPSRLSASEQNGLEQKAIAGVQALDMTSAAAHVEFIGSRLGEIGARPGGNRPRILELACGIDLLHAYYQVLSGASPDVRQDRQLAAAIVTPFPRKNGTLRATRHLEQILKLPGYVYHEVRAQPGQPVGLASGGFRAPLYVELMSPDTGEIRHSVDQLASWSDLYEVE